jgi:hypothetical protein
VKRLLSVVGHGPDGQPVYGGAFRFCETHGMPLEDLLAILRERRAAIDAFGYLADAIAAGMKPDKVARRLEAALRDSGCDPAVADAVAAKIARGPA